MDGGGSQAGVGREPKAATSHLESKDCNPIQSSAHVMLVDTPYGEVLDFVGEDERAQVLNTLAHDVDDGEELETPELTNTVSISSPR
uniref:Uncharacterized protein n=1 Tax=Oryza sativa subsp. indica TaxID=39946 RepID=Q0P184_ORYSI|nr:hypothetical protein TQR13L11.8 [Oryza sativa Indica Group]